MLLLRVLLNSDTKRKYQIKLICEFKVISPSFFKCVAKKQKTNIEIVLKIYNAQN